MIIKIGDLFNTSWGYDQTNYDFLIVLAISKTGKTVKCQMVIPKKVGHSSCCDILKATKEGYGDIFRLQIRDNGHFIKGSYPFCGDGLIKNARMGIFTKTSFTEKSYQTNSYSGH